MGEKNYKRANESVKHNTGRLFALGQDEPSHHTQRQDRATTAAFIKFGLILLLVCAIYAPQSAYAQLSCESCEVEVGAGETYHYWATTGSLVIPVTVTWSDNRYE